MPNKFSLIGALNWLADRDAAYRDGRRASRLSDQHLADVGLTRADLDRAFRSRTRHVDAGSWAAPIRSHL